MSVAYPVAGFTRFLSVTSGGASKKGNSCGMLACLALIALYVMLVIATWKNCMNAEKKTWLHKTAMAIFCGASGYMVVGLANDSSVCVAPLFWILMGLGFAVNHMIKRSKAKEEEQ